MILVDTSIWVDHLRTGEQTLAALLDRGRILIYHFVLEELSLGNLARRRLVLDALADLPRAVTASDGEVLKFIEDANLHGTGIGYIDAHLLAAVRLTPGAALWTRDRRLEASAETMGLAATGDL